ncbi:1-acyl-sn-glycerol-3-phosphate acyltransferase, partial [Cronbergia sp. UHCC 0137]|uniref:lysophospholipid acyltransferase family protein n=1 Tax=Cronbergia sp. UHCC 0137 TaxID=3110239 RepID=UPI002B1FDDC6
MRESRFASTIYQLIRTHTSVNPKIAPGSSWISPWLSPIVYAVGRYIVLPAFFGKINITGQEHIPQTGAVILAPTHRSRWDSLLLPYATGRFATGRDLRFMVTSSECQGLQGWFVLRMGGFPVDPHNPAIATLRHSVDLLQREEMLVIYPEGGIFRDGKVHPLKPGIARLALTAESIYPKLGIKILPISINYNQPIPSWGANVNIHIGESLKA